jgi:hypothetical protein
MKRAIALVGFVAGLVPAWANAEFREVKQTIFGMD